MRLRTIHAFLLAAVLLCLPATAWAAEAENKEAAPLSPDTKTVWLRHFRVLDATWATCYRYIDQAAGQVTSRDLQYRTSTHLQINLDPEGKTYFQGRLESGNTFIRSRTRISAEE